MSEHEFPRSVKALAFTQWLSEWDSYDFQNVSRKPEPQLYLFSMPAAQLRRLCDVYRRERDGANAEGIQRLRDDSRTARIQRYVRYGYPYGDLRPQQRTLETLPLRKPGWLPTAIVVNILTADDKRRGRSVDATNLISVEKIDSNCFLLKLPSEETLKNESLAPLEVIDGQHRLWAFDDESSEQIPDDFELPVVAFYGLDIPLQAYLFWSINVSPKRINPSHAYDLYPLLRNQSWLEQSGELTVYREARSQELTEILYTHVESPWQGRINMLGSRGGGVSQAAWVRSLMSSFFGVGRGQSRAGLFQAAIPGLEEPLGWSRAQQAAFLIEAWIAIKDAITRRAKEAWWIRCYKSNPAHALTDKTSMLNQDMGVRASLACLNDIFFDQADAWRLDFWILDNRDDGSTTPEDVTDAIASLRAQPFHRHLTEFAAGLTNFDWRSLEGPDVKPDEEVQKRSYRGSGGYTALRLDVFRAIAEDNNEVAAIAKDLAGPQVSNETI